MLGIGVLIGFLCSMLITAGIMALLIEQAPPDWIEVAQDIARERDAYRRYIAALPNGAAVLNRVRDGLWPEMASTARPVLVGEVVA